MTKSEFLTIYFLSNRMGSEAGSPCVRLITEVMYGLVKEGNSLYR